MTPEEISKLDGRELDEAVALWLGWKPPGHPDTDAARQAYRLTHEAHDGSWLAPGATKPWTAGIPGFSTSISAAINDVEGEIARRRLVEVYLTKLGLVVGWDRWAQVHATAEQRCIAALLAAEAW